MPNFHVLFSVVDIVCFLGRLLWRYRLIFFKVIVFRGVGEFFFSATEVYPKGISLSKKILSL